MLHRNLTLALAGPLLVALVAGCTILPPKQPLPNSLQPTDTLPPPTACERYTETVKCPCGASYTLVAWEDLNANQVRDDGDRPLAGIAFQATWNQWEQTTVDTCTGRSATSYSTGHKNAMTDEDGKADLFVTSCHCDDPAALDLRVQVSQSLGYRLVTQDGWSFGFQR